MLVAQANALKKDAIRMCRGPEASFSFGGDFCQAAMKQSLALRTMATVLASKASMMRLANALKKAGVVAGKVGLGLTTPKGIAYAAGVAAFSASTVAFGALTLVASRACFAAARLEGGLAGAELAASTCPFVVTTLAQGTMLSAVFAGLSGYALYREGDRQSRALRGRR